MQRVITITKAIADGNRLRILMALSEHPQICACQITELLGITGATVSRHLAVLSQARLVEGKKDGRWINFSLVRNPETEVLLDWLATGLGKTQQIENDRVCLSGIFAQPKEDICRKQRGETCCPTNQDQIRQPIRIKEKS